MVSQSRIWGARSGRSVSFGRYDGHYLSRMPSKTLVHALVASWIDFCNSILYRVAAVHLRPLQSVLNATPLFDSFRSYAISIVSRSQRRFAMSYTGYQFTNESSTNYASLCSNVNRGRPQPQHTCRHSARRSRLSQPSSAARSSYPRRPQFPANKNFTYSSRASAVSGPTYWNLLPSSVKSPSLKPAHFCKQLKTTLMAHRRNRRNYVTRFARR